MLRETILTREIHNLVQGSDAWHNFRAAHHGASEAAAMLGLSKQVTRNELLRAKATGVAKEFSDWVQANILDYGHEVEALARPLAEKIIGDDLYPVTFSLGAESASCDGLTMDETIGWEHKQWNEQLAASVRAGELPDTHMPQVQQQLMVTGAEKWLFMVSDGTEQNIAHMWVYPDAAWFDRIRAGWEQFDADAKAYVHQDIVEPAKAAPLADLPVVTVQVRGELAMCNLKDVTPLFDKFLAEAKVELVTDDDFALAEAQSKKGRAAAQQCKLTAKAVVDQMQSVAEVTRALESYAAKFDAMALRQEKAVKEQKDARRATAKLERDRAYAEHIASLEAELAPVRLQVADADKPQFTEVMKNQRTLASLYNKLDTELARAKIAASERAKDTRAKLAWYNANVGDHAGLFRDLQQIIGKAAEDFQLVVRTRIADHQRAEEAKQEALRARIAAEEKAKAEAAARAELERQQREAAARQAEIDRQAAEAKAATENAERDRVAAATKAQLEQKASAAGTARQQAAAAAIADANRLAAQDRAGTPAPAATGAADVQRTTSFYNDQSLRTAPAPDATGTTAGLFDAADREINQDIEFLTSLASAAGLPLAALLDRLVVIDIATLRAELRAAA